MAGTRVFMVVEPDETVFRSIESSIKDSFPGSQVYYAREGNEAMFKMKNVVPDILLTDMELHKNYSGKKFIEEVLLEKQLAKMGIIVTNGAPDNDFCVDEVANGKIQFVVRPFESIALTKAITKAFDRQTRKEDTNFRIKVLLPDEVLCHEGEKAGASFLLKKGKLRVFSGPAGQERVLGEVFPGEFVGEMACLSGEPRSASVKALENSELIEIPSGSLDTLVLSKPAWAKALMKTLSNRLKAANLQKKY